MNRPQAKGTPTRPLPLPSERHAERPYVAIWEVTRACDLACVHCRAEARPEPFPGELGTEQGLDLIRQVAAWGVPLFVMTGGDPLKRADLPRLARECSALGMNFALAPSITPLLDRGKLLELREAGLRRVALSLDGADAATFDAFRGVPGTFDRFLEACRTIRELGIGLQVNTTLSRLNRGQIRGLARLLKGLSIDLWSVFFLVPTGRGQKEQALDARETEGALNELCDVLEKGWFDIKTTEAHHFRRILLQRHGVTPGELLSGKVERPGLARVARGVGDGRGFVFIAHNGDVCPSGFLPLSAGNVKDVPLATVYRTSWLFRKLRDTASLKGKCGRCEYRSLCGGSRARAYALTGDLMGADPYCAYQPAGA